MHTIYILKVLGFFFGEDFFFSFIFCACLYVDFVGVLGLLLVLFWGFVVGFLSLGNQNLFRQSQPINISFAIDQEYTVSKIANDLFYSLHINYLHG